MRKSIFVITLVAFAFMFSGCAKMLQPGSEADFSCAGKPDGVCSDIHDVYENRQDISVLKRKIKLNKMGEKSEYISKRCGIYQVSTLKTAGSDYETCSDMAQKEYDETLDALVAEEYTNASLAARRFGGGTSDAIDIETGIARRSPDKVHKIWIAPYTNDAGDLVGGHFVFSVTKPSGWSIKVNKVRNPESSVVNAEENSSNTVVKQAGATQTAQPPKMDQETEKSLPQRAKNLIQGLNKGGINMERD